MVRARPQHPEPALPRCNHRHANYAILHRQLTPRSSATFFFSLSCVPFLFIGIPLSRATPAASESSLSRHVAVRYQRSNILGSPKGLTKVPQGLISLPTMLNSQRCSDRR